MKAGAETLTAKPFVRLLFATCWPLISLVSMGQPGPSAHQNADFARWKTFTNRAGWTIKHPNNWSVGTCRQCPDPTDPNVFVTIYNPATKGFVLIEHLIDKPVDQTIEQWLNDVKSTTALDPFVREQWISLDGARALKVINGSLDSTESESIYVVHGSKTFAIRSENNASSYPLFQRMLSTFRFEKR